MNAFHVEYRAPNPLEGVQGAFGALADSLSKGASRMEIRLGIQMVKREMAKLPQTEQPLKHQFLPGLYLRTIINPKDSIVGTKIHREANVSTILRGKLHCITEDGIETLTAPMQFITKPGTERILYAVEETEFSTCHPNPLDLTDLDELERRIIAPDFETLEMEVL